MAAVVEGTVFRSLPRLISLVWVLWAIATALAYIDQVPTQLQAVDSVLPFQLWHAWSFAAVLMIIGVLIPPSAPERVSRLGRFARIGGLMIIGSLLIVWTSAFWVADTSRGWVSAKNYALDVFFVFLSAWWAGRDTAGRQEVN